MAVPRGDTENRVQRLHASIRAVCPCPWLPRCVPRWTRDRPCPFPLSLCPYHLVTSVCVPVEQPVTLVVDVCRKLWNVLAASQEGFYSTVFSRRAMPMRCEQRQGGSRARSMRRLLRRVGSSHCSRAPLILQLRSGISWPCCCGICSLDFVLTLLFSVSHAG